MTDRLAQGKRTLLLVEDDADTANLLRMYFSGYEYDVDVATRGSEAVEQARKHLPHLVLLDMVLPDLDGYQVCQALRASPRTSHIPVIFLSEKTSLSDRVAGLGAGAQDYITKPFDLEELRLRVQNLIARSVRDNLVDPRTGLPTGSLVEEQLRRARAHRGWSALECQLEAFQAFVDSNGFVAGDDVLKFAAQLLRQAVEEQGTRADFIGHPANDTFLILTASPEASALAARLRQRFNAEVQAHYSFTDREQGYILLRDSHGQVVQAPLMTLRVTERAL